MDTKRLGRLDRGGGRHPGQSHSRVGWRQLHVAIDLASRVVVAQLRPSCGNADTLAFLERARALGVRHTRTKPYHPWTNGRVERFNGTIQRECLYACDLHSEEERDLAIALYLSYYNAERPHIGLGGLPPLEWLRRHGTYVSGDLN